MSISSKELAALLNLSPAAVSLALNNRPGVSTETRKRVQEAARKYGYDFSRLAEKNIFGDIYFIIYKKHGAIVTDSPFFSQLTDGIAACCKQQGYTLKIIYLYEQQSPIEEQLSEWITKKSCLGILLLATEMEPSDLKPFLKSGLPLVVIDTYFDTISCDFFLINNIQGAYLATSHLIHQTNKQPGYLHSSYVIGNFSERSNGFFKAIRAHGMSSHNSIVHTLTPSMEGAYADMIAILDSKDPIASCYFADNDLIALGAMKALKERGYSMPNDIKIIGFDNIPAGNMVEPTLSTIHVPKIYLGEAAASRLIARLKDPSLPAIKFEVSTELLLRGSC